MSARTVTPDEWGRIFAHAWLDTTFAYELSTDPTAAVKSFLNLDAGSDVSVLTIPPAPADLTEQQLQDIRSGDQTSHVMPMYSC